MSSDTPRRRAFPIVALIGNLTVLVGLAFVVVELRQNRQSLDAEIRLTLATASQEGALAQLDDPGFSALLVDFFTESRPLTLPETVRMQAWIWSQSELVYAAWDLRNAGILTDEAWRKHAAGLTGFLDRPAYVRLFFGVFDNYPDAFMDELRTLAPVPLTDERLDSIMSSPPALELDSVGPR